MRYSHWIQPAKGGSYPGCLLSLACDLEETGDSDYLDRPVFRLTGWRVASRIGTGGNYGKVKLWDGGSLEQLSSLIARLPRNQRSTWCVVSAPRCAITALGLFTEDKRNRSQIVAKSSTAMRRKGSTICSSRAAPIILGLPPLIVPIQPLEGGPVLTLLSTQNWGLDGSHLQAGSRYDAAEILADLSQIVAVSKEQQWGGLRQTASAIGWHVWRKKDFNVPFHCHANHEVLDLERRCLYGGRCEAFKTGKVGEKLFHLDFRGLYPYCAATRQNPVALIRHGNSQIPVSAGDPDGSSGFAAKVRVFDASRRYPVRRGLSTDWPGGTIETFLCGAELQRALADGAVLAVYKWAEYRLDWGLRRTVERWTALRADSDKSGSVAVSKLSKAAVNGLIGRFAQRASRWEHVPNGHTDAPFGEWFTKKGENYPEKRRAIDWEVYREVDEGIGPDSCPIVTAFVTAAARMRLWDAMACVPQGELWYTDTDSLIVSNAGYLALLNAGWIRHREPGYLTVKEVVDGGEIFGRKHYRLGNRTCHGGVTLDPDCRYPLW